MPTPSPVHPVNDYQVVRSDEKVVEVWSLHRSSFVKKEQPEPREEDRKGFQDFPFFVPPLLFDNGISFYLAL